MAFRTPEDVLPAVSHVILDLDRGQITGLVGESGSGKSTLALTLLNAVPHPGRVTSGSVTIDGIGDVLALTGRELCGGYAAPASATYSRPRRTR